MRKKLLLCLSITLFSAQCVLAQIPSYIPASGLVAWYPFNGNPSDYSGNGHNGTNNGPVGTTDRYNTPSSAYQFGGSSDNIFVNGLTFSMPRTISFWYNNDMLNSSNQTIIGSSNNFTISVGSGGMLTIQEFSWSVTVTYSSTNFWHHVVMVANASSFHVYFDGNDLGSFNQNVSSSWGSIYFGSTVSNAEYFHGKMDDVAFWDRALSTTEIAGLYQRSNCLVAHFPMDGNTNDMSGFDNHPTSGTVAFTADRFGNPNSAASFDGSTSFLEGPIGNWPVGVAQRSMELWFQAKDSVPAGGYLRLLSYGATGTGAGQYIQPIADLGGAINTMSYGGSYYDLNINYNFSYGQWYHIVTTFNGSLANVYVNGVNIGSGSFTWNTATASPYVIGAYETGSGPAGFFSGNIDDIKVYGCVLTSPEIDSLYHAGGVNPCSFAVSSTVMPPLCQGGSEGSIDQTVSGGVMPFTFVWNNGDNNEDLNYVPAGNYSVVISDATGCDTMITYSVPDPASLGLSVNTTPPTCGGTDGSAVVTVMNGVSPYMYNWSNGDTTNIADTLSAGTYMVIVKDANGCISSQTFGLNSLNAPVPTAVVTDASCAGIFNGAIDVSVTGGVAPYTYLWAHNGSTSEDLSGLKPGSYLVQVTDANGCSGFLSVNVGIGSIDLSNVMTSAPTCGASDGGIDVIPAGASPFTFSWSSNAGGATTGSVINIPAGVYTVMITDANGCSEDLAINLSNAGGPVVTLISATPATCLGSGGNLNIGVSGGSQPYIYDWTTGQNTQDLTGVSQGTYSVNVSDGAGCITAFHADVPGVIPPPISLCMSTVDSATGKVLCVWEKGMLTNISHFNVYRENSIAGQYDYWFTQPWDSLSQWVDQTANPVIHGWRYKVTMVDSCGNESPFGANHKTLHLSANLGLSGEVNLLWDNYEGFAYPTFYISRFHPSTGWEVLDSVAATIHSYTDPAPPGLAGLKYTIEVKPPSPCVSTRAENHNSTRSNRGSIIAPSAVNEIAEEQTIMTVYPNPTNGMIQINLYGQLPDNEKIRVYDINGKLIYQKNISGNTIQLDLNNFDAGMYFVALQTKNQIVRKRVIKQ